MMDDPISRQAAVDSAKEGLCDFFGLHADDIKFPITNTDYLVFALNKNITSRISSLPSAEPEDYTELKREFIRMASYIDAVLVCSDEQRETLIGFISRLAEFMPWKGETE